jgi:hypothetical protein
MISVPLFGLSRAAPAIQIRDHHHRLPITNRLLGFAFRRPGVYWLAVSFTKKTLREQQRSSEGM